MATEEQSEPMSFEVNLELLDGYRFAVSFDPDGEPELFMDEPVPLGEGNGPNASRVLASAVANCLSASLLFCLRKARVDVKSLRTTATVTMARNEKGRLRVGSIAVAIDPELEGDISRLGRCLNLFEDFCVVTESVRNGLPISVEVRQPATGA